jgi:KDO2-lipid IV(A) lauroyltransferase
MKAFIIKFFIWIFSLLPLRINQWVGQLIGTFSYYSNSRNKKIAQININVCYPNKTAQEKTQLVKNTLIEAAKATTELGPVWLWDVSKLAPLIIEERGANILDNALAKKEGVIIVAPHFGSWELAGLHYCQKQPMTILYSQPKIKALDSLIISARGRYGVTLAPASTRGVMQLIKALKKGEDIGLLPDQIPSQGNGQLSHFFKQPCYTMTLLSKLQQKSGATIVFSALERLPKGKGYIMHYLKAPKTIYDTDLRLSVDTLNTMIEKIAAINPEQYLWSYKRFKKIETNQTNIYKA